MTVPMLLALLQVVLAVWMFLEVLKDWPRFGTFITIFLLVFYSIVFLTINEKPNSAPAGVSSIQSQQESKVCESE